VIRRGYLAGFLGVAMLGGPTVFGTVIRGGSSVTSAGMPDPYVPVDGTMNVTGAGDFSGNLDVGGSSGILGFGGSTAVGIQRNSGTGVSILTFGDVFRITDGQDSLPVLQFQGSSDAWSLQSGGGITTNQTRNVGTITLSAGSGTATVVTGARCVCTDTTANASVQHAHGDRHGHGRDRVHLPVMRLALAATALLLGCAPYRITPPVGTTLTVRGCFTTGQGVSFFAEHAKDCPDERSATERVRRVEERYGEELSGARVYIVRAYVECGDHGDRMGCTRGLSSTVTAGPFALRTAEHELSHQAINRKPGGSGSLAEFDLDHPPHKQNDDTERD
jgi:hypothetical protein